MSLSGDDRLGCRAMDRSVLLKRDVFFHGRARPLSQRMQAKSMRCWPARSGAVVVLHPGRHLFARERRALRGARPDVGRNCVGRRQALGTRFINGVALHLAKPLAMSPISAPPRKAAQAASRRHLP